MQRFHAALMAFALIALFASCSGPAPVEDASSAEIPFIQPNDAHLAELDAFRGGRESRLRSETGWLALVGLHWLEPGANSFGSAADGDIVLPAGSAPAVAGSFHLDGDTVVLEVASGVEVFLNNEAISERNTLTDDSQGAPDQLKLGRLTFFVIKRGDRQALRVKDPESPARVNFSGLDYFPVDDAYRVDARFERFDNVKEIAVSDVVGNSSQTAIHGELHFSLGGESYSLLPFGDPAEDEFFIIFKDLTNGGETYAAGRYLRASTIGVDEGHVWLDFNMAYNPPCIFTPYATCPLPPKANHLTADIPAGEKAYAPHSDKSY
jgi:uncharacterized protein (DUF1684 family)